MHTYLPHFHIKTANYNCFQKLMKNLTNGRCIFATVGNISSICVRIIQTHTRNIATTVVFIIALHAGICIGQRHATFPFFTRIIGTRSCYVSPSSRSSVTLVRRVHSLIHGYFIVHVTHVCTVVTDSVAHARSSTEGASIA